MLVGENKKEAGKIKSSRSKTLSFIESKWCIVALVFFRGSEALSHLKGWLLHQPQVLVRIQAAAWNGSGGSEPRPSLPSSALHDAGHSPASLPACRRLCRCAVGLHSSVSLLDCCRTSGCLLMGERPSEAKRSDGRGVAWSVRRLTRDALHCHAASS